MKSLHNVTPPSPVLPGSTIHRAPGLEIWGVVDVALNDDGTTECEQVDPDADTTPHFWSIYEHEDSGECMVVDDFQSREVALATAVKLASPRGLPVFDFTREGYRP